MKKLGEICCKKQQIVRAVKKYSPTDDIVYIDISAIDSSTNEIKEPTTMLLKDAPSRAQQVVEKNDILVSLVRPNLKNIALICDDKNNLVASSGFCVLRTKENPRFLKYIVLGEPFTNYLISRTSGANYPAVREDDVKGYSIPLPPLPEQEKIVAELDCLSGIIEKKKQQLKELDALAQSIFYEMFGDPIENEKGWEVKKLGEVATSQIGLTYKPEHVSDNEDGVVVLRSGNIQDNEIDLDDIVRVNCPVKEQKYVQKNDILMCSRNGSHRLVGKVAMIPELKERMTYGAFMTIIRSEYQFYLFEFFKTPCFRMQLSDAQTSTINQITVRMLNEIKLSIPPIAMEHSFASKIEAIEKQKALIKQSIAETETLFNSRMQEYFN